MTCDRINVYYSVVSEHFIIEFIVGGLGVATIKCIYIYFVTYTRKGSQNVRWLPWLTASFETTVWQ